MRQRKGWIYPILLFSLIIISQCAPREKPYDIVIKNGVVIDGSGASRVKADVGLKDKFIVKVGKIKEKLARKVIDAQGLIVSPGFIDIHTHCDREILKVPTADNYIYQGVTTVIGGNCGGHPFPLRELFQKIEEKGITPNFGCLVGHNTIRRKAMSFKAGAPTPEEIEEMKALIESEMKSGALGFSTGLSYLPGTYAKTEELVELASIAARYGGLYATHLRDQGQKITEAINEALEIGEKNSMAVQISHIKLAEEAVWNEIERIRTPVEEAQKRGVKVSLDQYPYMATSSGFTSSLPSWAFEGGKEQFLKRLKTRKTYEKIKEYVIERRLTSTRGIEKTETIYIGRCLKHPEYEGKNLKEILISLGKKSTPENAADLIIEIEKDAGASGVFFQMDEADVEELMRLPYNMHASDGGIQVLDEGVPHPRNYGTFPRVISFYVREKGIIPLEEAIRKMTYLPAQTLGLEKRGLVREGMYADLTIFNYETFKDRATFNKPHQYTEGLEYVFINGEAAVERGTHTEKLPGMVLYGKGKIEPIE